MGKHDGGRTITYFDGAWHEGSPDIIGPRTHGFWMSSTVFDGARVVNGKAPDLAPHCARLLFSGEAMGLRSPVSADEIVAIARDGIERMNTDVPLYVCPMLFGGSGFIYPDPDDTKFVMCLFENPLPKDPAFTAMKSSFRRPAPETAPTTAKASCLYPNVGRAVLEAKNNGYDTGVMLDPLGNVAEFSYANLFMVKDGSVSTPAINGTFLNGITRQRVIKLLRADGVEVVERTIRFEELLAADELFGTGNYYKVAPCVKLDQTEKPAGPMTKRASELYWAFAAAGD